MSMRSVTRPDRSVPRPPAGPGERFVLNVWTQDSGWVRHEFDTPAERLAWADNEAPLGADVRWSQR